MINRETIRYKLERMESNLTKLDFILKRQGSVDEFLNTTKELKELVVQVKAYIELEPRSSNEINTSI